jgi:hypothetical protein
MRRELRLFSDGDSYLHEGSQLLTSVPDEPPANHRSLLKSLFLCHVGLFSGALRRVLELQTCVAKGRASHSDQRPEADGRCPTR